jgi:hypothetical protein
VLCSIGGKSNSGEGGEDPSRWETLAGTSAQGVNETLPHLKGLRDGDVATSKIKQALLPFPSPAMCFIAAQRADVFPVYWELPPTVFFSL